MQAKIVILFTALFAVSSAAPAIEDGVNAPPMLVERTPHLDFCGTCSEVERYNCIQSCYPKHLVSHLICSLMLIVIF